MKYLVGIDEAGRGPLAGPVAVGVVQVPSDFDWNLLPGVGDSKKLKPEKRLTLFRQAQTLYKKGHLKYAVAMIGPATIDNKGIVPSVNLAIGRCIKRLKLDSGECYIKLDGSLKAPNVFSQETIVKGDDKELVIGLASVLAKVTRDRYMERVDKKYPQYDFSIHKGYGTKKHRHFIKTLGSCPEHRQTFIKNCR